MADSSSSGSEESTGASDPCGNGIVDPGEDCDDGNREDGDACSSRCSLSFEVAWTVSYDGPGSHRDSARGVIVDADDEIYVVGSHRKPDGDDDLWLSQYHPDGTEGWTFVWDGPDGLDDAGSDMAWTPEGKIVIVGDTASVATDRDILILVVDPTNQMASGTLVIDGPGSGMGANDDVDGATAVDTGPDGSIVVAGTVRVDGQHWNAWVGKVSPDGTTLLWEASYDSGTGDWDGTQDLVVGGDGTIYQLIHQNGNTMVTTVVLQYTEDGTRVGEAIDLPMFSNGIDRTVEGDFLLIGQEVGFSHTDINVRRLDSAWTEMWSVTHDGPASGNDTGLAVMFGNADSVLALGRVWAGSAEYEAWIGAYQSDGTPVWSDTYGNTAANLSDSFSAAAVDSQGDVIAVGVETVLGQQTNALIRKYHPL